MSNRVLKLYELSNLLLAAVATFDEAAKAFEEGSRTAEQFKRQADEARALAEMIDNGAACRLVDGALLFTEPNPDTI